MERIYLRSAIPADIDSIADLEARCFAEPWAHLAFGQFIGAEGFLVAIDPVESTEEGIHPLDGYLCGYVVTTAASVNSRTIAHVRDLAVDPLFRRCGLGSRLLDASLDPYRSRGFKRARLEVRVSNRGAIEMYKKHGFRTVASAPGYYGDGEAAVVMVAILDDAVRAGG